MKVNLVNIGCFKNLVDCEYLMWQLRDCGIEVVFGEDMGNYDCAIINTCGFISDAEAESDSLIRRYALRKQSGGISRLWVMGCYGQKKGHALMQTIPEIDRVFGNFDWHGIVEGLSGRVWSAGYDRVLTTPSHYAYIKISEGCNMGCAYCIKPIINGAMASRPIEDIVKECTLLASQGVKELQIVAQITTAYGMDIYRKKRISDLVRYLSDIPGIEWIRLHYAYPGGFPLDLLEVINERDNVCKYLDMAIQHCNSELLKKMRRPMTRGQIEELITVIRDKVPGISLRTTVMTGFPGETPAQFNELADFVKQTRFDRLGVFPYSHEAMSFSGKNYEDTVPELVKRRRAIELMDIQRHIYEEENSKLIGHPLRVVVDSLNSDGTYTGRSEASTPMADPKVIIHTERTPDIGSFLTVTPTKVIGKDIEAQL